MADTPLPPLTPPPPLDPLNSQPPAQPQSTTPVSSAPASGLPLPPPLPMAPLENAKPAPASLPSAPPVAVPPPIIAPPPAAAPLEAPSAAPVNPLSPQRILERKNAQSSMEAPRQDLLEQSILPPPAPFAVPEAEDDLIEPAAPATVTPPPQFAPMRPQPVPPPAGLAAREAQVDASRQGTAAALPNIAFRPRRRSKAPLFLGITVLLLAVGSGVAYLMARNGTRVPYLYTTLIGVPADGTTLAAEARSYMAARTSYQFDAAVSIKEPQQTAEDGRPVLPGANAEVAGRVHTLEGEIIDGEFRNDGSFRGRLELVVNPPDEAVGQPTPVNFALKSLPEGIRRLNATTGVEEPVAEERWLAYFPNSLKPEVVEVSGASMRKSLAYPAIQPFRIETLLQAASSELAYQYWRGTEGAPSVRYLYAVNTERLAASLPVGATLENAQLLISFSAKNGSLPGGLPQQAQLTGTLKYQERTYEYEMLYSYGTMDQTLTLDDPAFAAVVSTAAGVDRGVPVLVSELGILSVDALPNTLSEEEKAGQSAVLTPAHASASEPLPPVTESGPPPSRPVSEENRAADVHRREDLALLKQALELYKTDRGSYPVAVGFIQLASDADFFAALVPKYLTAMPVDPQKDRYYYSYQSDGTAFRLRAVALDLEHPDATLGTTYPYYELTN